MSSATTKTTWPSTPIPEPVKDLLNRWYALTDDKSENAALRMSKEIFTPDATWVHPKQTFVGEAEIAKSRDGAWHGLASQRHEVLKVYTCSPTAEDLLMFGNFTLNLENGKTLEQGFCARAVIDDTSARMPKFTFFQGWTDATAFKEALRTN